MRLKLNLRAVVIYAPLFVGLALAGWQIVMAVGPEQHIPLPATSGHGAYVYDCHRVTHWPVYVSHRLEVWRERGI